MNNEKQRSINLVILIFYTVLAIVLIGESVLLGWDKSAIVLLIIGVIISWVVHITEKIPQSLSIWLYFFMTMIAFFFYGIHETSVFDLAPVMIILIMMYSAVKQYAIIRLCTLTYAFTMIYDLFFVVGKSIELDVLMITRILLHFLLVYIAAQLVKKAIKREEQEKRLVEERVKELEKANRKAENFLVNVSHELRTPINAVMGLAAVLLENEEDKEKRKDILFIKKAGYRLFNQIEEILDYTEIDSGKVKISEEAYMIPSLVNDIISTEQTSDEKKELELIFDVDVTTINGLIGDGEKIKKILKHLIDNAKKFTKKGGVFVQIDTMPKDYGVNLEIKVSDTGVGISEEKIEKISEKFYQSNSERNRSAGGLGLGMSIVYGMVAEMGGFVRIESEENKGTVISISIPQKLSDSKFDISLNRKNSMCIACYLKPDKYTVPEIRNYYSDFITHIVTGLDITVHRVSDEEELERVHSSYQITHLFVGKEEYKDRPDYYESLCEEMVVVVAAEASFELPKNSRIRKLAKPFYFIPVINILNSNVQSLEDLNDKKSMICPNIRTLIVDDEPMNLMVAEGILKNYQMEVTTAGSGMQAIELCKKETFDIVFLDHMMPEMDGVETLKILRKNNAYEDKHLTIIAFTANAVSGAREMFLQEGFDEFVSKPVEILELERVLKKVLPKSAIEYLSDMEETEDDAAEEPALEQKEEQSKDAEMEKESVSEEDSEVSESEKDEVSSKDAVSILEEKGIDTTTGSAYCMGDMNFYMELLKSYEQDAAQKEQDLNKFLSEQDWENYRILIHSVKSTSKMIGAMDFSEMARLSEEAAKQFDGDYIAAHHQEIIERYHEITDCIRCAVAANSPEEKQTPEDMSDDIITREDFITQLGELKDSLDTFEADRAEKIIEEIKDKQYEGKLVEELLKDIVHDIEEFEMTAAMEKTVKLTEDVKGGDLS